MKAASIQTILEQLRQAVQDVTTIKMMKVDTDTGEEIGEVIRPALSPEGEESVGRIAKRLNAEGGWSDKFTSDYVRDQLHEHLIAALSSEGDTGENVATEFAKLLEELTNYSKEHRVLLPLPGVMTTVDEVQLGPFRLFSLTKDSWEQLVGHFRSKGKIMGAQTEEQRLAVLDMIFAPFAQSFLGGTVAEYVVVAEPQMALQRAEDDCRHIIDLLRYTVPVLYRDRDLNVALGIGFSGESGVRNLAKRAVVIPSDGEGLHLDMRTSGAKYHYSINAKTLDAFEALGVFAVSEILRKANRNGFETTLLTALHWYANSQTEEERQYEFLGLITTLETFLTAGNSPITVAIAEGVARIVGVNLEERLEIAAKMRELYGKRGAITHHGNQAIDAGDLYYLRVTVHIFLEQLIKRRREFQNTNLVKWLEEQRLS